MIHDIENIVDFTAVQLQLCYDKLVMYPEVQEDIKKLIAKLKAI